MGNPEKLKMLKEITIIVESAEDNKKIETHIKRWIGENFEKFKEAKIRIEDLIQCPICKDNLLISLPVNAPLECYYCHFCNKKFKKEEIEKKEG